MSLPDRNNPYSFQPVSRMAQKRRLLSDDEFMQRMVRAFRGVPRPRRWTERAGVLPEGVPSAGGISREDSHTENRPT